MFPPINSYLVQNSKSPTYLLSTLQPGANRQVELELRQTEQENKACQEENYHLRELEDKR